MTIDVWMIFSEFFLIKVPWGGFLQDLRRMWTKDIQSCYPGLSGDEINVLLGIYTHIYVYMGVSLNGGTQQPLVFLLK